MGWPLVNSPSKLNAVNRIGGRVKCIAFMSLHILDMNIQSIIESLISNREPCIMKVICTSTPFGHDTWTTI